MAPHLTSAHPMRKLPLHRLCTLAVLASALLSACGPTPAPNVAPQPATPIVQGQQLRFPAGHPQLALLPTQAARAAQDITVELPARLVWNEERTQRIYPAFAGRVTRIDADVGQRVQPGSALAHLASPDFGQAQADTARAQVDARLMTQAVQRQRELFAAGIIARKDLEQSEADAARAQAEVARAQARTALYGGSAQVNQQLSLSSGIAGVVVERNLNPGQELRPDQSGPGVPALFVVSDPASLWVQIDAREIDTGILKPGASFELEVAAYPGTLFQGKVLAASDFIDPSTRTIKVRGLVANADRRLKAEMLATARVHQTFSSGVVVPAAAITLNGTHHAVFVQTQPGVFEPRDVTLVHQGPKEVVVSKGLQAGERVVSDNALLLARQFHVAQEDSIGRSDSQKRAPAAEGKESTGKGNAP